MGVSTVSPLNIARERVIVGPNSVIGVVFARERSYVSEKKSLEINENAARAAGTLGNNMWCWDFLIRQDISDHYSPPRENCS